MDLVYRLLDIGFHFSDVSFERATQTLRESAGTSLMKSLGKPLARSLIEQSVECPMSVMGKPMAKTRIERSVECPMSATECLHATTKSYAREWLHSCLNSHGLCMLSQTEVPHLPRRVLDITQGGACCRLVEMPETRAYYAAVSHRWLGTSMYSTTEHNLQAHREQINLDRLSPSIAFAVQTATDLGLSYLWVDALCIIQDSEVDKSAEISKMADIYRNSCLTIAIVDPSVFRLGQHWRQSKAAVPLKGPEGVLDTRAWVLQEKILSRRVLSYTMSGVYFECLTHTVSSAYPASYAFPNSDNFRDQDLRVLKEAIQLGRLYSVNAPVAQYLRLSWHRVVEDYSKRHLTNARDKARAIAAVASRVADIIDDEYIAGLWRNNLIADLCWARESRYAHATERASKFAFRAPSWSWLNATYPVGFRSSRVNVDVSPKHVLNAVLQVQLKSAPNPLGEVTAMIRLQGILLDFHATMRETFQGWRQKNKYAPDPLFARPLSNEITERDPEFLSFEYYMDDICTFDYRGPPPDDAKVFWAVGMNVWLVLEPGPPGRSNTENLASTYCRIGIVSDQEYWETRKSTEENSLVIIDLV